MTSKFVAAGGSSDPDGQLALKVPPQRWPIAELTVRDINTYGRPALGLPAEVNAWREENQAILDRGVDRLMLSRDLQLPFFHGQLFVRKFEILEDGLYQVHDLGLASLQLVTNAGVAYIVDAFQNLTELENMKFHGIGTGTNAEAVGDTTLQTELTTQYIVNSTRATGSTTENAANIYETVATNEVDAAVAITEHGVFSNATVGSGTLLDRSVFAAVNLSSGDRLESTYRFTINAGG